MFAWKLSRDILPTKKNKHIRRLEPDASCVLCGSEVEDSFHAVVECPQARNLRSAMSEHWPLLDDQLLDRTGPGWLLLLLNRCTKEEGELLILTFWQAWTVHNNLTHNSGNTKLADSVLFLLNYRESLLQVDHKAQQADNKGKAKIWEPCKTPDAGLLMQPRWEPPPEGWTKLNVDDSFIEQTGEAGIGVIITTTAGLCCRGGSRFVGGGWI